jgi:hypothetical protein
VATNASRNPTSVATFCVAYGFAVSHQTGAPIAPATRFASDQASVFW